MNESKRMVPLDKVLALFKGDGAIAYGEHSGWYADDVVRVAFGRKPRHGAPINGWTTRSQRKKRAS